MMMISVKYNWYDFISVPAILNEAIPATSQNVDGEIQGSMKTSFKYTALIQDMLNNPNKEGPSVNMLKQSLINSRQHESFLRTLLVSN